MMMIDVAKSDIYIKYVNNYEHFYAYNVQNSEILKILTIIKRNYAYTLLSDVYNKKLRYFLKKVINIDDKYCILFVPSDKLRFVERGFGVNEYLMNLLIKDSFVVLDLFIKSKHTENVSKIDDKKRRRSFFENKNPFEIMNVEKLENIDVVYIFDDVLSSGATIECLIRLLNKTNYTFQIKIITIASSNF
ncbi:MAG: hypothetical protein ACRCXZ_10755 [Patescibacteria group bacterium]